MKTNNVANEEFRCPFMEDGKKEKKLPGEYGTREDLLMMLSLIPETQLRRMLYALCGDSFTEIAEREGVDRKTVYRTVRRGIEALKMRGV